MMAESHGVGATRHAPDGRTGRIGTTSEPAVSDVDPHPAKATGSNRKSRLRRGGSAKRRTTVHLTQLAIVATFFVVWQVLVNSGVIDPLNFGSPTEVASKLGEWITDGTLLHNFWVTFYEAGIGFVIAVVAAVTIGIVLARSPFWDKVTQPFIDMVNATPRFALAPLFVLLVGIERTSKIVLVVSIVFFIMLVNTLAGVKAVNEDYVRLGKVCGGSKREIFAKVILPATGGYVMAGLRLSVPYALGGAVVGEMLAGSEGLGYLVANQAGLLEMSGVLAAVLILAIVGWGVNGIVTILVRRTPWARSEGPV